MLLNGRFFPESSPSCMSVPLPAPFQYARSYPYECTNPSCHACCQTGAHYPPCKTRNIKPHLLNWTSVPVPVCNRCLLSYRLFTQRVKKE